MSEAGTARSFWKRNRSVIQVAAVIAAIAAAIAIPFVQAPLCSVSQQYRNSAAYRVTIDSKNSKQGGADPEYPAITRFSFGPSVNGGIGEVERTESTYYPPEQEEDWGRRYWCDVKAGDYFLVLFTLALAISTFFLWRETERLAERAADQSDKMRQSIREQRRAAYAAIRSAKTARNQVAITRKASEDALRPYVLVNRAKLYWDEDEVYIVLTCANSGQTPATFFQLSCSSTQIKRGTAHSTTIPADARVGTWGPLGGNDSTTANMREKKFTEDVNVIRRAPFNSDLQFFVFGTIRYADVFGNEYETDFEFFTVNVLKQDEPVKMSIPTGQRRAFVMVKKAEPPESQRGQRRSHDKGAHLARPSREISPIPG